MANKPPYTSKSHPMGQPTAGHAGRNEVRWIPGNNVVATELNGPINSPDQEKNLRIGRTVNDRNRGSRHAPLGEEQNPAPEAQNTPPDPDSLTDNGVDLQAHSSEGRESLIGATDPVMVSDAASAKESSTSLPYATRARWDAVADAPATLTHHSGVLFGGLLAAGLALGGGNGGSASSPVAAPAIKSTSQLVDGPISGVGVYQAGVLVDTTDADGKFEYEASKGAVTFKVGQVVVGTVTQMPADGLVMPQDIAGVARTDTSNELVLVIARFFQTLDEDGDPSKDGIAVNANKLSAAGPLTLAAETDLSVVFNENVSIVSSAQALAHLPTAVTPDNLYRANFTQTPDSDATPNEVAENSPANTLVGLTAQAIDPDRSNNTISYGLVSDANGGTYTANQFVIDGRSGVVTTARPLTTETDGETMTVYVKATSTDGTSVIRPFTVRVQDDSADLGAEFTVTVAAGNQVTNEYEKSNLVATLAHVDEDAESVTVVFTDTDLSTADLPMEASKVGQQWLLDGVDIGALRDGEITVIATVTDDVGNFQIKQVTFTLDTTAPTIVSQSVLYSDTDDQIPVGVVLKYSEALGPAPDLEQFSVSINGSPVQLTGVSVSGDELSLDFTNEVPGAVAVSYTPSAMLTRTTDTAGNTAAGFDPGLVADGLMRNAQVWIDVNGNGEVDGEDANSNGQIDPEESTMDFFVGLTDAQGHFFVPENAPAGNIIAVGGYNIDTGVANDLMIKAPEGALVVNPLTTLVQEMLEQQLAAGNSADLETLIEQAAASVAASLGLSPDIDLTTYDPIASGNVDAQKAAAQIATTVTLAAEADPGNASTVMSNLATVFQNAGFGSVNLSDSNVVSSALSNTVSVSTEVFSAVSDAASAIGSSASLDSISRVQSSALDRVAPAAPTLTTPMSLTNDTTPTVRVALNTSDTSGRAVVAGDVIRFFETGLPLDLSLTVTENDIQLGWVELEMPHLVEGTHEIGARLIDRAGNMGDASSTLTLRVDNTAPAGVTLNRVATDDIIGAAEAQTTLSGQTETGARVLISLGARSREVMADQDGSWSYVLQATDLQALGQGTTTLSVVAQDGAGNPSNATQRAILVDTLAPTVTGNIVKLLDNVLEGLDDITVSGVSTNDNTLGLVGTLSARLSPGETVIVFDTVAGVTSRLGVATVNDINWTFSTPSLGNGPHALSVRVQDSAGNSGPFGPSFSVQIDATVPDTLVTVTPGAAVTGQDLPLISGTLSKALVTGEKLLLFDRGVKIAELGSDQLTGTAWSVRPNDNLADGEHEITATVQGPGGNQGARNATPLVFVVDTQAPTVKVAQTLETDAGTMASIISGGATRDNTLTLRGLVADASGVGSVQLLDGGAVLGTVTPSGNGNWTLQTPALIDGLHSLAVKVVDLAGNITISEPLVVTVDTTAPQAPGITPFATDNQLNAQELTAALAALDGSNASQALKIEGTAEANARILITLNAATGVKRSVTANGAGSWSYTLSSDDYVALGQGTRSVQVSAIDAVGNMGATTILALEVDTKAPALTSFTLSDGSDTGVKGDGRSNLALPTIQFVAEAGVALLVNWDATQDPEQFLALGVADGTLTSVVAPNAYEVSGSKTIVVRSVDAAGNITERMGTFELDITAPDAPALDITSLTTDGVDVMNHGANATVARAGAVVITGERGAQISVNFDAQGKLINKTFTGTGLAQAVSLSLDEIKTLGDGMVSVAATQTDAAGNVQAAPARTMQFKLDTSVAMTDAVLEGAAVAPLNGSGVPLMTQMSIAPPSSYTVENGARVEYRLGTVAADASISYGNWGTTPAAPGADGHYLVQVRQIDLAGNTSAPQNLAFVLDTQAPVATASIQALVDDVGPQVGTLTTVASPSQTDDNSPQLIGRISGSLGAGEQLVVYDILGDISNRLGVALTSGSQWSFTPQGLDNGLHRLRVRVEDAVGNSGVFSDEVQLEVDTTRPQSIPTIDDLPSHVNTTAPALQGGLSAGLSSGEVLQVFDNGRLLGEASVSGLRWSFTPALVTLNPGNSVITAAVRAYSGVLGNSSASFTLRVDTELPTVTMDQTIGTDSGAAATVVYSANQAVVTRDGTLALRGSVQDNTGIEQVELFDGVTSLGTAVLQGTNWSLTTTPLSGGAHVLTAKATDLAGNVKSSTPVLVVIDDQAPPVASVSIVADDDKINALEVAEGKLLLSGASEANARVLIQLGTATATQRTVTADDSGNWSYAIRKEDLSAWGQGSKTLSIAVSDAAGNLSAAVQKNILIDTLAPTLTPVSLTDDSDSGLKGDGRTSSRSPGIQFTAEAGNTVSVDWKGVGQFVGNHQATGGVQTLSSPDRIFDTDGTYNVTVRAQDSAGNVSLRTLPLMVDGTVPSAPSLNLAIGIESGGASLSKAQGGLLSVNGEVGAEIRVSFARAGVTLNKSMTGTGTAMPVALTAEDVRLLGDGSVSVSASQTDTAGNVSVTPSSVVFVLDTHAATPNASLWVPGNNGLTNQATLKPATQIESGAVVEYRLNWVNENGSLTTGTWGRSYTAPHTNGEYQLQLRQIDLAGNVSEVQTLTFILDQTAPQAVASITGFDDNVGIPQAGLGSGATTDDNTPTLRGTVSGPLGLGELVVVYDWTGAGAVRLGSATVTDGLWAFDSIGLSKGLHTLRAVVEDPAGNASTPGTDFLLNMNGDPPATTIQLAGANSSAPILTNLTSAITLTGVLSSALQAGETVRVLRNGALTELTANATVGQSAVSFTLPVEMHTADQRWSLAVQNGTGLLGVTSDPVVVRVDQTAPTLGAMTVIADQGLKTNLTSGDATRDNTLSLSGSVNDVNGVGQVEIFHGASKLGNALLNSNGTWSFTTSTLAQNSYALTALATDVVGNQARTAEFIVQVLTTQPAAPQFSPLAGDGAINIAELSLALAGSSMPLSGSAPAWSSIVVALPNGATRTAVANQNGSWSLDLSANDIVALGQGSSTITARASDAVGNFSDVSTTTIRVDTLAPGRAAITQMSQDSGVSGDGLTNDATPEFTIRAEPGATLKLYRAGAGASDAPTEITQGISIQAIEGNAGTYRLTVSNNLSDGNYGIVVLDGAGNSGPSPSAGSGDFFRIDRTTPEIITGQLFAQENQTATWTLQSSEIVSWSLTGGNQFERFNLSNGQLSLKAALDFENPALAPPLEIQVKAVDLAGNESSKTLTLSLNDINEAPTAVGLLNSSSSLAENTSTASRVEVATLSITDDALGNNAVQLAGADAAAFEVINGKLYLKAGTVLDHESQKKSFSVTLNVADAGLAGSSPVSTQLQIAVTDVNEAPTALLLNGVTNALAENTSTASRVEVATLSITDDALGSNAVQLAGPDAAAFEVINGKLYLKAGTTLNHETRNRFDVTVRVEDTGVPGSTPLTSNYTLTVTDVNEAPTAVGLLNASSSLAENTSTTSRVEVATLSITDDALGNNAVQLAGADAAAFEVIDGKLYLKAGTVLDHESQKKSFSVTLNVADAGLAGSSPVSTQLQLAVTDVNEAPTANAAPLTANLVLNKSGQTVDVANLFSDPDAGDALTYTVTAGNLPNGMTLNSSSIVGTPANTGMYGLTLAATDRNGLSVSKTIQIHVIDGVAISALSVTDAIGLSPTVGKAGEAIHLTLTFSEPVTISGSPTLTFRVADQGPTFTAQLSSSSLAKATHTVSAVLPVGSASANNGEISLIGVNLGGGTVMGSVFSFDPSLQPNLKAIGYRVDNTSPGAAAIFEIDQDQGVIGDRLINDPTPVLKLSAEPDAGFKLFRASTTQGASATEITTGFTVQILDLASGTYTLAVTQALSDGLYGIVVVDGAGNLGPLPFLGGADAFLVDATLPVIGTGDVFVLENQPGAWVLQSSESVTWSLVEGADAALFELSGAILRLREPLNHETVQSAVHVRVMATDAAGNTNSKLLNVRVDNVNEAPAVTGTPLNLSVTETDEAPGTLPALDLVAGRVQDVDPGDVLSVDLRSGLEPQFTAYWVTSNERVILTDDTGLPIYNQALASGPDAMTPIWLNGNSVVLDPSSHLLQALPAASSLEFEIDYQVRDASGLATDRLQATVTVAGANDAPMLVPGVDTHWTMVSGEQYSIDLSTVFLDLDQDDVLAFSPVSLPSGATLTGDGYLTVDFPEGMALNETLTLSVRDLYGATIQQTFTLEVLDKKPVAPFSLEPSSNLVQLQDQTWIALSRTPALQFVSESGVQASLLREQEDYTWTDVSDEFEISLTHADDPSAETTLYTLTPTIHLTPARYAIRLTDAAGNEQSMKDTAQFEVWSLMEGSGAFDDLIFQPGKQVLLAGDGYDVLNLPGVYANSEFEANEVPRSLSIGNGIYIVHDLGLGLAEVIDQAGNVAITQGIEALMLAGETALHLQTVAMDLDESHIAVMGTPWLDRFDLTPYVHAGATQALWDEWESILRWLDDTGAELDVMQVQNTLSQDGTYTLELTDMDNDAILLESIEQITGPGGIVLFNFDPESGLLSSTLMV